MKQIATAICAEWEATFVAACSEVPGVQIRIRCVDTTELLAQAVAGEITLAVISAGFPGLDRQALRLLRENNVSVLGLSSGNTHALRILGINSTLEWPSPISKNDLISALLPGESAPLWPRPNVTTENSPSEQPSKSAVGPSSRENPTPEGWLPRLPGPVPPFGDDSTEPLPTLSKTAVNFEPLQDRTPETRANSAPKTPAGSPAPFALPSSSRSKTVSSTRSARETNGSLSEHQDETDYETPGFSLPNLASLDAFTRSFAQKNPADIPAAMQPAQSQPADIPAFAQPASDDMAGDSARESRLSSTGSFGLPTDFPAAPQDASELLPPTADTDSAPQAFQNAQVLTVFSAPGSVGRSTISIHLALELAQSGQRVMLIDADAYSSSIGIMLGILDEAPGIIAAARHVDANALTVSALNRVLRRYGQTPTTIDVLTGMSADRWPEVSAVHLEEIIALAQEIVDVVVVDIASHTETDEELSYDTQAPQRNALTCAALSAATQVIAVATPDPVGLQRLVSMWPNLQEKAPQAEHLLVVNRVRDNSAGNGINRCSEALTKFLGQSAVAYLPEDQDALDEIVISARPDSPTAEKSSFRQTLRQLIPVIVRGETQKIVANSN